MRSGVLLKGNLFYTVGCPHSGKSTFANDWIQGEKLPERGDQFDCFTVHKINKPRVVLGGDDFRSALTGHEFVLQAEGMVASCIDIAAKALLNRGFDVLIDETSSTKATLIRYYRLDINATPIFIDTSREECIRRAIANKREYLVGPINRIANQLDKIRPKWDETIKSIKEYVECVQKTGITV